jgi:hypothetical protein
MHSLVAVALTPTLAAILRLDMPAADSLSAPRILRMGNLCPGIAPACGKGAKPMPIRGLPPAASFAPIHWLVAIARMAGRDQSERLIAIVGRAQPST